MTYEECIATYGQANDPYCSDNFPQHETSSSPWDAIGNFFGFIFSHWLQLAAILILIIIVLMSIKIIRQKTSGIVERLGRYNRTLEPGLNFIVPFIEKIVNVVELQQFNINVKTQVKTKDEQVVTLPITVFYKVTDPRASVYEVEDPEETIKVLVNKEVKAKAAMMTLQDIFDDRDTITNAVKDFVNGEVNKWGFEVNGVPIDNPELTKEMVSAYNSVAVAERAKQAATAEGDAYKIRRDRIAEGNSDAITKMVGKTNLSAEAASSFLISVDTNDAVRDAAKSGATIVVSTSNPEHANIGLLAGSQK